MLRKGSGIRSNAEHVDEFLNRRGALLKRDALFGRQVDLDDLFEAARAELAGHADVETLYAVLAFQIRGAGQNLLLVFEYGLRHLDRRSRGRVVGRAGLEESDYLRAAVGRALHNRVELLLRDEFGDGDACARRVARQWNHRVAVSAQHKGRHVLDRHVEGFGEETAHARGVQNARHTYDAVLGEAGALEGHLAHRVERVRDDDEDRVGRVLDHFVNDRRDDAGVRLQ